MNDIYILSQSLRYAFTKAKLSKEQETIIIEPVISYLVARNVMFNATDFVKASEQLSQ